MSENQRKLTVLKALGNLVLVGVTLLAASLAVGCKELAKQKEQMAKTDGELIGRHFYMPREGAEDVDMNLYLHGDGQTRPLVVNLHGGAFIAGDSDTLDTQSDRISHAWNVNVATVNYKLAGGGYDVAYGTKEAVDAVKYFIAHADEYCVDSSKIFILGYSAGAYHAAAAVLDLKREGIDAAGQILCYGFVKPIGEAYLRLTEEERKTVAPALFILADYDPISSGSLSYQKLLADNGVRTATKKYKGAKHGFIEENNPEYYELKIAKKSPKQEAAAREAENFIGAWIGGELKEQ